MLGAASHANGTPSAASGADQRAAVGLRAARDDPRAAAEQAQRARGVVRRAADARPAAVDHVAREVPDHRDAAHRARL